MFGGGRGGHSHDSTHCARETTTYTAHDQVNPAFVNTPLISESKWKDSVIFENMIQPEDVAEICLLPFRLSAGCVPSEVTLRLTVSANK